jgi:hypothetical protein
MRAWISCGLIIVGAACSSPKAQPDAGIDAGADAVPDVAIMIDAPAQWPVDEPADCGGDPLIAHQGDLAMTVSAFDFDPIATSYDLNGDGQPDNKMAALASISSPLTADGLAMGTFVVAIEIFDRDADPDACLKLAAYRGTCVGTCNFSDSTVDTVSLDPTSLGANNAPTSRLRSMSTTGGGVISSDPGYLEIDIPITDAFALRTPIHVHRAEGTLQGGGLSGFHVGGTMRAFRLDLIAAPEVEQIGLSPDDSVLDAFFANLLGPLIALPRLPTMPGCRTMDIDIDNDGLEAFCDSDPDDTIKRVDTCIDGDGTIVRDGDGGVAQCSQAMVGGVPRFTDGISISVTLDAKPATINP